MSIAREPLSLIVNGAAVGPLDVPKTMLMSDFLGEYLGLTGTRMGCGQGVCSACSIILEEPGGSLREVRACITNAHWFAKRRVRTIEGVARRAPAGEIMLSPVQQAFVDGFAFQCGYCTPGFVIATTVFLDQLRRNPINRADLESAIMATLDSHLCRCTGYVRYYEAVRELVLSTPGLVRT